MLRISKRGEDWGKYIGIRRDYGEEESVLRGGGGEHGGIDTGK